MYILMLHDLEDVSLFGTEDEELFNKAENSEDLQEFIYSDEVYSKLTELGDDLTGITVKGFTYDLAY